MSKLVSIIIPVYNVKPFIKRCLESIISQDYKNLEIILVDDGSTDGSGEICDEYVQLDKRVKVIHKINGGLSEARNVGIEIAKGEYIGFVDSDDLVALNMYKQLVTLAEQYNADIVSCKYKRFYSEQELHSELAYDEEVKQFNNIQALENYFQDKPENEKEMLTVVCNKIYRKKLFDKLKFPVGKIYEDGYVTYKLLYLANQIVSLNAPLYYYYQREGSLIHTPFSLQMLKSYDDWRDIFRFIDENVPHLSSFAAQRYIRKYLFLRTQIEKYDQTNQGRIQQHRYYKEKMNEDLKQDFKKLIKKDIRIKLKIQLILFIIR